MTEPTGDDPVTLFDLLDDLRSEVERAYAQARQVGYVEAARIERLTSAARAFDVAATELLRQRGMPRE